MTLDNEFLVRPRAVILEDDVNLAHQYEQELVAHGYQTTVLGTISEARSTIRDYSPELILVDKELPDGNALDLMDELGASARGRFVVIDDADSAPTAIQRIRAQGQYPGFWIDYGSSPALRNLRIAASLSAEHRRGHALICGEPGVEKTSVAQAVHYRSRRLGKYIHVNCASETGDNTSVRFFGESDPATGRVLHKGYLEQAKNGTLVLENVHCLTSSMQSALMSFLDSGQFRPVNAGASMSVVVAVIGISGDISDNGDAQVEGLRADFLFRLAQTKLVVPALSQCVGDIESIARFILFSCRPAAHKPLRFSRNALDRISSSDWSGNIRQLRAIIAESLEHHQAGQELELVSGQAFDKGCSCKRDAIVHFVGGSVWDFEKRMVLGTLEHHAGDRKAAAKMLGISLKTLYNRLNSY